MPENAHARQLGADRAGLDDFRGQRKIEASLSHQNDPRQARRREDARRDMAAAIDDIADLVDGLSGAHEDLTSVAVAVEEFIGSLLAELRFHALAHHAAIAQAWPPIEGRLQDAARGHAKALAFAIEDIARSHQEMAEPVKLLIQHQHEGDWP